MGLRITLTTNERLRLIASISRNLEITPTLAALRIDRLCAATPTKSIDRVVLEHILVLAQEFGKPIDKFLVMDKSDVFALFDPQNTLTYIGAFNEQQRGYAVSTSVLDHIAARRLAKRLTPDFRALRFSPSLANRELVSRTMDELARNSSKSIVSLGTPKANIVSELLAARSMNIPPFRPHASLTPPAFVFCYPQQMCGVIAKHGLADRFSTLSVLTDSESTDHAYILWNNTKYYYSPQSADQLGVDYAVVVVSRRSAQQPSTYMIVAGLSAIGTLGASMYLCDDASGEEHRAFTLPVPAHGFTRAFLLKICFEEPRDVLPTAKRASVIGTWTATAFHDNTTDASYETSDPREREISWTE